MSNKTANKTVREIYFFTAILVTLQPVTLDQLKVSSYISVPANIGPRLNNPIPSYMHRCLSCTDLHHSFKSTVDYSTMVLDCCDNLQSTDTERLS